ncbi:MAG: acyl carrier protein [Clostridiales bacterium]|nr:acyl carrier protein [Clostridiales bacterium]
MLEKITGILSDQLGIDVSNVTEETSFQDDLRIDSLDLFEVVTALEDEFEIEIPQEELDSIKTVGDVIEYLASKGIE